MDRQEREFAAGVRAVGDAELERLLWPAVTMVRQVCERIAGGEADHSALAHQIKQVGDIATPSPAFGVLRRLTDLLAVPSLDRRALHALLVEYGCALTQEDFGPCALPILSLSERVWADGCDQVPALEALYRHSLIMIRGARPLRECAMLPALLAGRARSARSQRYLQLARVVQVEYLILRGLQGPARELALRLAARGARSGLDEIVANAHLRLAMIEGRAARFDAALTHATDAFLAAERFPLLQQNALFLMGMVLSDLERYDDARKAFELASVGDARPLRVLVQLGLMKLALSTHDHAWFEALERRLGRGPMSAAHRTFFVKLSALGRAARGDVAGARELLEQGRTFAHGLGLSFEYLDFDRELTRLQREAGAPPRTLSREPPDRVATVLAVRHERVAALLDAPI